MDRSDPFDPFNNANDYLEIGIGDDVVRPVHPCPDRRRQRPDRRSAPGALENWSNENNVFQFVRVEDIAYDPDSPRTVYFADTGTTRLAESADHGRLRLLSATDRSCELRSTNGRIFKMVMNASNPRIVDPSASCRWWHPIPALRAVRRPRAPGCATPTTSTSRTTASWSRRTPRTPRCGDTTGDADLDARRHGDQTTRETTASRAGSSTCPSGSEPGGGRSTFRVIHGHLHRRWEPPTSRRSTRRSEPGTSRPVRRSARPTRPGASSGSCC